MLITINDDQNRLIIMYVILNNCFNVHYNQEKRDQEGMHMDTNHNLVSSI